jgi:hypothetical protein
MLRAYIDDSHMGQPPLYTLGGWVAPASTWEPFSNAWRDILWMKPRIEYFKFDEALSLDGQFHGITEASRNEKLRLMINLIEETNLLGLVSMIPHHIFDRLFGRNPSRYVRNPYILSFFGIIARLARHMSLSGEADKVEFVFDYQPHSIKQVLEGWQEFKDCAPAKFRKFITEHPPQFLDDKNVVALQAADLHAGWAHMRNEPVFRGEGAPPEPPWGKERGEKIRGLFQIWDQESCSTTFEELFGFKPQTAASSRHMRRR